MIQQKLAVFRVTSREPQFYGGADLLLQSFLIIVRLLPENFRSRKTLLRNCRIVLLQHSSCGCQSGDAFVFMLSIPLGKKEPVIRLAGVSRSSLVRFQGRII